jgi:hypothetical protein
MAAQPDSDGRYLYIVRCTANLSRLDTVTEISNEIDLTRKTNLIPRYSGHLDGCMTAGAVLSTDGLLYTTAPTSLELDEKGEQHYRILAFQIPSLSVVKVIDLPINYTEGGSPGLHMAAGGKVIVTANGWDVLEIDADSAKPLPGTSSTLSEINVVGYSGIDLNDYAMGEGKDREAPAYVVETSGDIVLVQLLGPGGNRPYAVVNQSNKRVTLLGDLPSASIGNVHLAPGGGAVLVEESHPDPSDSHSSLKTGKLLLLDAVTGKHIKEWNLPNLKKQHFLALTPNGKAVYFNDKSIYSLIPMSMKFKDVPVVSPEQRDVPYVFASR